MFTLGNGEIRTNDTIRVVKDYTCVCGNSFQIDLDWPKGVSSRGEVKVANLSCPSCGTEVVMGEASHEIIDGKLVSTPL